MSESYTRLRVEREGPVGWIAFDRPDAANASAITRRVAAGR